MDIKDYGRSITMTVTLTKYVIMISTMRMVVEAS